MKYRVSVLTGLIHPYQFYSCLPSSWQHFKNHSLLCVWGQLLSFLFEPFPSHVSEKGFLSFTFCVKVSFSSTTKHPQLMLRHVTAIMGFSWVGALGSRMLHWPLGWFTAGSPARWGGDGVQTVGCEISALNVWIGRIDTIPSTYSMIHNMFSKLLYFEWSPPWHVGWRLSGEGCHWEYDGKNGEFENIDFRFPWLSDTSEMGFGHDVPFLNYSDRLPHPSDLCQPDRVRWG